MGISGGADALYHLEGLLIADVAAGIRGMYEDRKAKEELNMDMATIDGDSNNILKVVGNGKTTTKSAAVAMYFLRWRDTGITVHPMVDGRKRPTAKKATCDRRAKRHKDYIKSYVDLKEVNRLKRELADGSFTAEEIIKRTKDIKDLEGKSCKKLARSQESWPEDFAEALEEELVNGISLRSMDKTGGCIGSVFEAKYEADYAIIGRFLDKKSIAAITADSDIAVMAGDGFPCIKKFTDKKDSNGKVGMTIVSTSKATILSIMKHIPNESLSRVKLKDAVCPIFEDVKCRKLRALMMVACGCDVVPPGIKGVRPKTLKKEYLDKIKKKVPACESNEAMLYDALFDMIVSKSKLSGNVIDTFVKGLIYQPTNYKSCEEPSTVAEAIREPMPEQYMYMDAAPASLPSYLFGDFAQTGVTTLDEGGPEVLTCVGAEDHGHNFLSQIGFKNCHGCNGIICEKCTEVVNDNIYCLPCAAGELLVPRNDDEYTERINFMREELKTEYQYDGADDLPVDQVEIAYNAAITPFTDKMDLIEEVKFPVYPTSELSKPTKWRHLYDIHFCNGGTFINEPSLSEHVPALLHLFASFVKYQGATKQNNHPAWMKAAGVYDALPETIINFAQNSRVKSGEGTGFRLLERCVRHGHDPRMQSLFYSNVELIQVEESGDLGIVIGSKVPASMRGVQYDTITAHTVNDLLAVKCGCKSGSSGEEKVTCVHNTSLPYGITKLMYEGLAEHILIELTSCIAPLLNTWNDNTTSSVKESIIHLMEASGESLCGIDQQCMTIDILLDRFLTGTEKAKAWGQRVSKLANAPKPGPIRTMCFDSPTKKAKQLKGKNKREIEQTENEHDRADEFGDELNELDGDSDCQPNYLRAASLIRAAGIDLSSFNPVGCRLLKLRADKTGASPDEIITMHQQMGKCWRELESMSKARKRRTTDSQCKNLGKKRTSDDMSAGDNASNAASSTPTSNKRQRRGGTAVTPTPQLMRTQQERQAKAVTPQKKKMGRPRKHPPGVTPKYNRKTPKPHTYCSKEGCKVNNVSHPKAKFHRIPAIPPDLALDAALKSHITRIGKLLNRKEIMDRAGFKRALNPNTSYRICDEHHFESVVKAATFIHTTKARSKLSANDDDWVVLHKCTHAYRLENLPEAEGAKSTRNVATTKVSTGLPTDRMKRKYLEEVNKQIQQRDEVAADSEDDILNEQWDNDNLVADAAEARLAIQQMAEANSPSRRDSSRAARSVINESVAKEAGMKLCFDSNAPPVKTPCGKEKFFYPRPVANSKDDTPRKDAASDDPVVQLGMSFDVVQHKTGFRNESMLLAFVFLVCDGDVDLIKRRCTPLTWYEEWFFFAEMIYGRSFVKWWQTTDKYGPHASYMRRIFRQKLALVKRARRRWGYFVTYDEDVQLRKDKWNIKYRERDGRKTRVIMWDMTGIEAYRFGAAELQRNTYSKYYGGNYFKGGIGIQLCSWGLTWPLWGGHESDTGYHESSGYLESQEEFQKKDRVRGSQSDNTLEVVPFTIVLDKGYRARATNWRHGEQLTAQPIFGKSDKQFKGSETKYSASLASDRGANERGVNVSKRSDIIKRGFKPGMDPAMFDDVWLCWGFMANFMYKQVL